MQSSFLKKSFLKKSFRSVINFPNIRPLKSAHSTESNEILKKQKLRESKIDELRLKELKQQICSLHKIEPISKITNEPFVRQTSKSPDLTESPYILNDENVNLNNDHDAGDAKDSNFINSLKMNLPKTNSENLYPDNNVTVTAYGMIRKDSIPSGAQKIFHKKTQNYDDTKVKSNETSEFNLFDEQYFEPNLKNAIEKTGFSSNNTNDNVELTKSNYIEEQYFHIETGGNNDTDFITSLNSQQIQQTQPKLQIKSLQKQQHLHENNEYFQANKNKIDKNSKIIIKNKITDKKPQNPNNSYTSISYDSAKTETKNEFSNYFDEMYSNANLADNNCPNNTYHHQTQGKNPYETPEEDTVKIEPITRGQLKKLQNVPTNINNPTTAYDAVVKMRMEKTKTNNNNKNYDEQVDPPQRGKKWTGPVDSKGFKILTTQVRDVQRMIDADLISMLCDSILFENEQVLVIDKPYGLPSHGGSGVNKSVATLLEKMAARREKLLNSYKLVHRLDKETTGVMVLAKTEQIADILMTMFKKRQVIKTYWALTKGVPDPTEGKIDIPMAEGVVENKYRMELRPRYNKEMNLLNKAMKLSDDRNTSEAITNYKVLSSTGYCALVECTPETGVKHQIRCHLAFALNTPVLGDHKYSHLSKLAPQKLYPEILEKLGIRQAKVRHLAMHLHARSLVLPEFLPDGKNLFVSARLPSHFVQNMKWLKLSVPK